MFTHLLKLIWKRKGRNMMLSLEILIAFVIVFAIAAFALRSWQLYQMPIGFVYEDVWSVQMTPVPESKSKFDAAAYDTFKRGLEALPGVKQVAFASSSPYMFYTNSADVAIPGTGLSVNTDTIDMDDAALPLLGVELVQGRLFGPTDDGSPAKPVIINRRLARALFGTESAVGKQYDASSSYSKQPTMNKVVGVIDEYRNKGELEAPGNVTILRYRPAAVEAGIQSILIKVAPGTPRAFEYNLGRQLKLINNAWTYDIAPLAARRTNSLSGSLFPLMALSVIAAFLLLMVAFGLFGVLWQNTTRRIPEIGLRRAIGANAGHIYRQIIAEQFLLSTGAMLVALLLLVQLPITGALGEVLNWRVFFGATVLSMLVIYLLSLLCSVYPGWRASRLSPTEALHYE